MLIKYFSVNTEIHGLLVKPYYNMIVQNIKWYHLWYCKNKSLELELKALQKKLVFQIISSFLYTFSSVQSLSRVQLFATPWTAARQASLSITNSRSPPKPMSIDSVMPSNHLILCSPLLLLPSTFPSIRAFSNESALHIRWPKYWSHNFSISPSNEHQD